MPNRVFCLADRPFSLHRYDKVQHGTLLDYWQVTTRKARAYHGCCLECCRAVLRWYTELSIIKRDKAYRRNPTIKHGLQC